MRLSPKSIKLLSLITLLGVLSFLAVPTGIQAATETQTLNPVADAFVYNQNPSQNYGTSTSLRADGSPIMRSFMRFDLSNLSNFTITSATLKIYANSSLSSGFSVNQLSDHSWQESTINYNNEPTPGSTITKSGAISQDQWVSIDISSYITSSGIYDLVLNPLSDTQVNLASREAGDHAPQLMVVLSSSDSVTSTHTPIASRTPTRTPTVKVPSPTPTLVSRKATPTPTTVKSSSNVPDFSHVITIIFENREYTSLVGNVNWSNFNSLAAKYTLLTKSYAVTHPSLPNYLALTSGSTQGITSDCTSCFVNAKNIADLIEQNGKTWKAYMESMPSACYLGSSGNYAQKHNPFVYYDDIRTNSTRCKSDDVPLTQFDSDLATNKLPDYAWITPNLCNDGHDCSSSTADGFLGYEVSKILSSPAFDQNSLLIITFDEGTSDVSCCVLPSSAGGHIATLLISGLVKSGYQDATPYSHYSILKTIEDAWGLSNLSHTGDSGTTLITAPWK